jgi:O-Antigen ligase
MLASSAVPTAAEPVGGLGLAVAAGSAVAAFCALFFSGGFAEAPLVWVGALALGLAAVAACAAAMRLTPAPALDLPTGVFLGCLFGLAVWMGLSTLWSLSPDRTWGYTNRTLVYAAFALLGVLLAPILPRPGETVAHAAAVLLGLVLGWALLAKCVPALYPGYGLQRGVSPALALARLRAPLGYWNELALLADVTVPVALWLAAPRGRRAVVRAAGALLLFAAVIVLLLTYSRFGVALAVAAAAGWIVLDRDRVESLVAAALAAAAGAGAFGVALVLPGITKDGQSHAIRVHDGWVFGLVVLALGAAVFGVALVLARAETRRPLAPERRARVERIAAIVAVVAVLGGIAASAALGSRLWHEFTNPVSSQISSSSPGRLASLNSSNRWRWWTEEWSAFTSRPLAGTGAGTFQLTDLRLRLSPLTTEEPHNTPLQFLGETGIVGFLLYAGAAAAAALGIVRARRRASGGELAAVTALGVGLAAFLVHTVVDMDWNYVATVGPLLLVAGAVVGRRAPAQAEAEARARHPLLALAGVLFALGAVYSLAAPWLADRQVATATTIAAFKRAHTYDPLSTFVLSDWATLEDATGNLGQAQKLYRQEVSLEPENGSTWWDLGTFYFAHGAWKQAYAAFSNSYKYDSQGPAGTPCGVLDQARHKVLGVWPASCPRGSPRAATP